MTEKTVQTKRICIYMSGPIEVAKQVLRERMLGMRDTPAVPGGCVTIEPTTFIYDGAEEAGFCVGLVNYPRFPTDVGKLMERAHVLTAALLDRTCQHSALIVGPKRTTWITRRKP